MQKQITVVSFLIKIFSSSILILEDSSFIKMTSSLNQTVSGCGTPWASQVRLSSWVRFTSRLLLLKSVTVSTGAEISANTHYYNLTRPSLTPTMDTEVQNLVPAVVQAIVSQT